MDHSTKLTIMINSTALLFSFTNFDQIARSVVLVLSGIYTILKIIEIVSNWFKKDKEKNKDNG